MNWSKLVYWTTIYPRKYLLEELLPHAKVRPAGSRYVCDPPVLGTDIDFLIYVDEYHKDRTHSWLLLRGYKLSSISEYNVPNVPEDNDPSFQCYRKGKTNLIVTSSVKYYEAFDTATYICKSHNVIRKYYRIIIHSWMRGNAYPLPDEFPEEVGCLLISFTGAYSHALMKAYRARHELD